MSTTQFIEVAPDSLMRRAYLSAGRFSVNLYVSPDLFTGRDVWVKASHWCSSIDEAMHAAKLFTEKYYAPEKTIGRELTLVPMIREVRYDFQACTKP